MTSRDRQADPTATTTRDRAAAVAKAVTMAVLAAAALFSLAVEVLYLPVYVGGTWTPTAEPADLAAGTGLAAPLGSGSIPVPVTVLIAVVVNVSLVAAMRTLTRSLRLSLLPVMVWTAGFLVCTFPGPGGDKLLMSDWPTLLLLLCGLVPALLYAFNAATAMAPPAPTPTGVGKPG
ncbi:MAG TPA: hypothetical protein VK083_05845 [Nocardia sp.]|uniref:hypothetical protein n=1 Tax=Nocardia sp. TaxID=1821 RepID=UPI002B4AD41D|nr:hypothetical protein [Nocardia sp.]HLS76292.1 hypothetical protein [Nocardia sp.]